MRGAFIGAAAALALVLAGDARAQARTDGRPPADRAASLGRADAPVRIVAFCDFESRPCARLDTVIHGILRDFGEQVRFEFRHLAGDAHVFSRPAYRAALAAAAQGRYWSMHRMLFANQDRLSSADIERMAVQLGLDGRRFASDSVSSSLDDVIEEDAAEARRLDITATPAVTVNGRRVTEPYRESIAAAIREVVAARTGG